MKTLLTTVTLVFTLIFSSTSFAEWTEIDVVKSGNTVYVDFDRIRKHDGYVYYWKLVDILEPDNGELSIQEYVKADCKLFRRKILGHIDHQQPMGRDDGVTSLRNFQWDYPKPRSLTGILLSQVCGW